MIAADQMSPIRLVGLDAASQHSKFGYALGTLHPTAERVEVEQAGLLGDRDDPLRNQIVPFVREGGRVLIAIDAPLGWPDGLRTLLHGHQAGVRIPDGLEKDPCFRRHTDLVVRVVKAPLEVGADRIARAAFEALRVLDSLRNETGLSLPLAWSPGFTGAAAIEVYPGATMAARKLTKVQYKLPDQGTGRNDIIGAIVNTRLVEPLSSKSLARAVQNADVLDAILCLVAARDFLLGECGEPDAAHAETVRREGWIWVRRSLQWAKPANQNHNGRRCEPNQRQPLRLRFAGTSAISSAVPVPKCSRTRKRSPPLCRSSSESDV
jgi:hypothetical protein